MAHVGPVIQIHPKLKMANVPSSFQKNLLRKPTQGMDTLITEEMMENLLLKMELH